MLLRNTYDKFIEDLKEVCNASTVDEKRYYVFDDKKEMAKKGLKSLALFLAPITTLGACGLLTRKAFGDKKIIRNQQLLYGVAKLYLNDLDAFMKS